MSATEQILNHTLVVPDDVATLPAIGSVGVSAIARVTYQEVLIKL